MIKKYFFIPRQFYRSPMAEFVMKDLVQKAGLTDQFHIASAATSREEIGNPVYPPARRKLTEHGINEKPPGSLVMQEAPGVLFYFAA